MRAYIIFPLVIPLPFAEKSLLLPLLLDILLPLVPLPLVPLLLVPLPLIPLPLTSPLPLPFHFFMLKVGRGVEGGINVGSGVNGVGSGVRGVGSGVMDVGSGVTDVGPGVSGVGTGVIGVSVGTEVGASVGSKPQSIRGNTFPRSVI